MPDINSYIQQARQQGLSDDQIRHNLLGAGWKAEQIDQDLVGTSRPTESSKPKTRSPIRLYLGFLLLAAEIWLYWEYIQFSNPY